jgi:C4-dicarboxylate-specific signal transduction histidine kinase
VASVAHELNNPLQIIKNCLFLLQQDLDPGSASLEYLNMASSETQRLSNLVTQLRELYRPRMALATRPFSLSLLLEEVNSLIASQLQATRVSWSQEVGEVEVVGNTDQLKQVFLNLATNAMEAMAVGGGGRIQIQVVTDILPGMIGLVFKDNGPGVSSENLGKLFEPFFTTKSSGLGLGLPSATKSSTATEGISACRASQDRGPRSPSGSRFPNKQPKEIVCTATPGGSCSSKMTKTITSWSASCCRPPGRAASIWPGSTSMPRRWQP